MSNPTCDDSLMPGTTHNLKPDCCSTMLYKCLMIKDGKKKALIDLGWIGISISDDAVNQYYDAVKPKQAGLTIGNLMIGDRFYICRTKEKGVVIGAAVGGRVPVYMINSLRSFTPDCGHTFNIQTRVKRLWTS